MSCSPYKKVLLVVGLLCKKVGHWPWVFWRNRIPAVRRRGESIYSVYDTTKVLNDLSNAAPLFFLSTHRLHRRSSHHRHTHLHLSQKTLVYALL